jgi:hypothetical protein
LNYKVLVADVDAVWRHNPLPYLQQHLGDSDLLGQNDNPGVGQICGGFMLLANTQVGWSHENAHWLPSNLSLD